MRETVGRAIALRAVGRLDEATPLVTATGPGLAAMGALATASQIGEVLDALTEAQQISVLEEVIAASSRHRSPVIIAQSMRARAHLLGQRGDLAEADAAYAGATVAAQAAGNPFALARTLFDHGSLLIATGRAQEAGTLLQRARSLFSGLRAEPWVEQTDRLLAPAAVATR
jgi:tetratricopeptide (TPR) repeat protein